MWPVAIGRTVTREELNNVAGSIGGLLWSVMDQIGKAKNVVDDYTAEQLVSAFGFTLADANDLKAAYSDMGQLVEIFRGTANLATVKNFRQTTRRLLGTGLY
jgi:hypothetical protein